MTNTVQKVITILENIAKGDYSNDIMKYTTRVQDEDIRRIAEAVGMMMVKVEAREYHLQLMVEQMQKLNKTIKKNAIQTIGAIAKALGARDEYTEGHAERVANYSKRLACCIGLSKDQVHFIKVAGILHDIGKIGFSDKVFEDTESRLSDEIFSEIRLHPVQTFEILKGLEFIGPALDYAVSHHEKLDGTGYPDGLKGDQIPMGARILAVADCFDAITTTRSYRAGRNMEEAFDILEQIKGNHLDPSLVEIFIKEIKENGMETMEK